MADEDVAVEGGRLAALLRGRAVLQDQRREAGREVSLHRRRVLERNALGVPRRVAEVAAVDLLQEGSGRGRGLGGARQQASRRRRQKEEAEGETAA